MIEFTSVTSCTVHINGADGMSVATDQGGIVPKEKGRANNARP
jgi:hypothetical protein